MPKDLNNKSLAAKLAYGRKRGTKASVLAQASTRRLETAFDGIRAIKPINHILIGDVATLSEAAAIMGRKGGKSRATNMTPAQRSESCRTAALRRWENYRLTK